MGFATLVVVTRRVGFLKTRQQRLPQILESFLAILPGRFFFCVCIVDLICSDMQSEKINSCQFNEGHDCVFDSHKR